MTHRPNFEDRLNDWLEEGPAVAPDELLDNVLAAIPSSPQRRGAWGIPWRTSPMYGFVRLVAGFALAVGVGAAVLFVVLRPTPGGIGDPASPSPAPVASATPGASPASPPSPTATPVPTPAPTPKPTAAHTTGPCDPAHLAARITLWEGAAGHRIAHVELTNVSSSACTVRTMAKPQLVDGRGSVLIDGTAPGASKSLTVAPGGILKTLVQDGNYCGPAPVAPVSVAFVVSGGGRILATPLSPTDATVPPCLGPAGSKGTIEMQPWAP
jgi:hypothetical protein